MFTVLYIAVVLLQLSFGQAFDNEPDTSENEESTAPAYLVATFTPHTHSNLVNEYLKITDEIPVCNESFEDIGDSLESSPTVNFEGPADTQGEDTIAANYESHSGSSDEEIVPKVPCVNVPKNIIRLGSPVKAEGKVTIIANFGCKDDFDKNLTAEDDIKSEDSSEDVHEIIPVSFSGPVNAQGAISIAAHFNCQENGKNVVSSHGTTDSKDIVIDEVVPDGSVSFGGPVYAQGKVSIGTNFGCGAPVVIPPIFLPMPWSSTFPYPQYFFPYPYSTSGSFLIQSPESGPFISPRCIEHTDTEHRSFENSQEYLPVASIMANSNYVSDEDDLLYENMSFNGIVPACGTVKIATRF